MTHKIVIDATNAILGRLASYAAKQALIGKEVIIINCDKAVISGRRRNIIEEYKAVKARGGSALKGPMIPSNPERLLKRTIRGMMKYQKGKSREAFLKIRCYNKVPVEYESAKKIVAGKEKHTRTISLAELGGEI